MNTERYFIISNSDGDTTVNFFTKEDLLKALTPDKNEVTYYGANLKFLDLDNLSICPDTNYWGTDLLIIKGKIVQLKVKETIKTIDIE
ncbi:MAG: hypothetical protein AABY22_02500 [Nanoarchaeota archaeon]